MAPLLIIQDWEGQEALKMHGSLVELLLSYFKNHSLVRTEFARIIVLIRSFADASHFLAIYDGLMEGDIRFHRACFFNLISKNASQRCKEESTNGE